MCYTVQSNRWKDGGKTMAKIKILFTEETIGSAANRGVATTHAHRGTFLCKAELLVQPPGKDCLGICVRGLTPPYLVLNMDYMKPF